MKIATKKRKKGLLALILIAILVAGGVGFYLWSQQNNNQGTEAQTSEPSEIVESEGSSFPIPDDVPEESIKDYDLETENEQYKIRYDRENDSYIITLYAIINNPSQYEQYQAQLKEYKANALQYLQENGVDINNSEIKYEPEEASDL